MKTTVEHLHHCKHTYYSDILSLFLAHCLHITTVGLVLGVAVFSRWRFFVKIVSRRVIITLILACNIS